MIGNCQECGVKDAEIHGCPCPECQGFVWRMCRCCWGRIVKPKGYQWPGDAATQPPPILCSQCGKPLQRRLRAFECEPCGRVVA